VRLAEEIARLVEEIRVLGPLEWPDWKLNNGHSAFDPAAVLRPEEVAA
jgi:hypothetical protein